MAVYYCKAVFIVFGCYFTGRVAAEGAYLIVKGRGVVDQLGLIKVFVEEFHNLVADFNADADIHGSNLCLNVVVIADMGEPFRTLAANGSYDLRCAEGFIFVRYNTLYGIALDQDVLYHGVKFHLNALSQQVLLKAGIDFVAFLCTQVTDGAFDEL